MARTNTLRKIQPDEAESAERAGADLRELRVLATQLILSEEKQRRQLAEGLHDDLAQSLAIIKVKLAGLAREIDSEAMQSEFTSLISMVGEALQKTRALTFELSSPVLHQLGLEAAIRNQIDRMNEETSAQISFEAVPISGDGDPPARSKEINALLFRSIRELLRNALKHAEASEIFISLSESSEGVGVDVTDDGIGFEVKEAARTIDGSTRFGLLSVREGIAHVGGVLTIRSKPGRGTTAHIFVPSEKGLNGSRI
ncbi:ATP-binding protein [Myxococcota bacterium]|nr:ATP-binding protein [Myxococcota bacterium]